MYGYQGRILHIDLSTDRHWEEPLSPAVLRSFVGGIGLGTYLLYRYGPAGAEPLAPESPLILATSPFVGTAITTSAKFAVVARSPLTGMIGDSLSSSHLAIELKRTGYDALVIRGACPDWRVLRIVDGEVELADATTLIGLDTDATEAALRRSLEGGRVAAIGPAGERLVLYASISNDGRQAGRTGTGAVMGSKHLKAIVVRGTQAVPVAEPKALRKTNQALIERSLGPATAKYRQLGTPANLLTFDRVGILPSFNFGRSTFAGAERVSGEEFYHAHLDKVSACAGCTIGCEHLYRALDEGTAVSTRMEYESLFALGPLLGIDDPNAILRAAGLCDQLGIDSISAGGTIAWAMECYERGLLNQTDTDGIDLRFGNAQALSAVLARIAERTGIGDLLAEGSRRASARVGKGSESWAMHVKGLELPGYEPRGLKTMALGLAVSPRGACHNRSSAYEVDLSGKVDRFRAEVGRGRLAAEAEDLATVLDSLILCKFVRHCFDDAYTEAAELYHLITGLPMTGSDLRQAGERINNLKKLFNIRSGWTPADDTLPPRLLTEPLADGPGAGERLTRAELDLMISGYYAARGWTTDGLIPREKLHELGLNALDEDPSREPAPGERKPGSHPVATSQVPRVPSGLPE